MKGAETDRFDLPVHNACFSLYPVVPNFRQAMVVPASLPLDEFLQYAL